MMKDTREASVKMSTSTLSLFLTLTLVALCGELVSGCPSECTCVASPPYIAVCNMKNLTSIPNDIPTRTEELYFSGNKVKTLSQGALSRYENLKNLLLKNCEIENVEPNAFSGLVRLNTLDLRWNRIQQLQSYLFSGLVKLQNLQLDNNEIVNIENFAFQGLNLTRLGLEGNDKLKDISAKAFHGARVEELTLFNSSLSSETVLAFVPLKDSLKELHWQHNQRRLRLPVESFEGFTFTSLKLNNDGISDIDFLDNVVTDDLSLENNPTGPIDFSRYPNLRQVRKLHLSNTEFSIVLASYFNGMTHLSYLGLANNGITSLSEELHPLFVGLQHLLLQNNKFHCNCELRWFKHWLASDSGVTVNNGEAVMCTTPSEEAIQQVEDDYLTCSEPSIVTFSRNLNVSEREEGTLTCVGEGDPAPTIIWSSPDGEVVTIPPSHSRIKTENQGIYHIKEASNSDKGTYVCTAVNLKGNTTEKAYVDVYKAAITDGDSGGSFSINAPSHPIKVLVHLVVTVLIACHFHHL